MQKSFVQIFTVGLFFVGLVFFDLYFIPMKSSNSNLSLPTTPSIPTQSPDINSWKTYKNSTYHYAVKYPAGFMAASLCDRTHQPIPDAEVVISTEKVLCENGFPTKGKLLMWIIEYDGDWSQDLLKPDSDIAPDQQPTILKISDVTINGIGGKKIVWIYKDNVTHDEFMFIKDNKTYRLTQLSSSNGDMQLFNQIVSTFKFTQ